MERAKIQKPSEITDLNFLSLFLSMRFISNFIFGIRAYFKAVRFIIEHKLYWFLIFPAVLMLIIYKLGAMVKNHHLEVDAENMNEIVWYLMYILLEISIAMLLMKFAKYLVVIILSPLISHLSVKTERILTGNKYPLNIHQLIHDIKRAMRIVIRNFMWEYFFFLIIFVVSILGWDDPKSAPIFYLTFVIGFFYYGFAFLDYINERRRLNIAQSIIFIRKNRGLAIAIGSVYSLLILVPVDLGALFDWSHFYETPFKLILRFLLHLFLWLCAAAAPILAITAATIAMNDLVDLKSNKHSSK
ncbi:MAG: EI24 domain-containing protein [Crocinitomicaceae bacterium]|nr:EI24 domain-containing protein [Crocinitomicaceae bacterium]MDG1776000.1 EI24 domain-containing protein [Crocinitomicaceae bacterium]